MGWGRAGQEVQRALRRGSDFGSEGDQGLAGVGARSRVSYCTNISPATPWWNRLVPVVFKLDIVGGPQCGEPVAAGGQLTDHLVEPPVFRVDGGLGAEHRHRVGNPACAGVTFARRDIRNSRISIRRFISITVGSVQRR